MVPTTSPSVPTVSPSPAPKAKTTSTSSRLPTTVAYSRSPTTPLATTNSPEPRSPQTVIRCSSTSRVTQPLLSPYGGPGSGAEAYPGEEGDQQSAVSSFFALRSSARMSHQG